MKKIRRKTQILCEYMGYFDEEPKIHTLYECVGKCGTHSTALFWFADEPKDGEAVLGLCAEDRYDAYKDKGNFIYGKSLKTQV